MTAASEHPWWVSKTADLSSSCQTNGRRMKDTGHELKLVSHTQAKESLSQPEDSVSGH